MFIDMLCAALFIFGLLGVLLRKIGGSSPQISNAAQSGVAALIKRMFGI